MKIKAIIFLVGDNGYVPMIASPLENTWNIVGKTRTEETQKTLISRNFHNQDSIF